ALALTLSCAGGSSASPQGEVHEPNHESITLAPSSPRLSFLKIETVAESDDVPAVILTGKVGFDENHTQRVASPIDGRVVKLLVEPGNRVSAGQVLVELSSPSMGQMHADAQKAAQDLALTEKALDRATKLKADGAVSEKEVAQVEADY